MTCCGTNLVKRPNKTVFCIDKKMSTSVSYVWPGKHTACQSTRILLVGIVPIIPLHPTNSLMYLGLGFLKENQICHVILQFSTTSFSFRWLQTFTFLKIKQIFIEIENWRFPLLLTISCWTTDIVLCSYLYKQFQDFWFIIIKNRDYHKTIEFPNVPHNLINQRLHDPIN